MSRNVRAIALTLLLVFVSASAAQALPLGERAGSLLEKMLSWVGTLVSPNLTSVLETAGSQMDPNGEPGDNNWSAPNSDEGSQMDPNGGR